MKWLIIGILTAVTPVGIQQCDGTHTDPPGGGGDTDVAVTAQALGESVTEARMHEVLGEIVGTRVAGSSKWQRAQNLCAQGFAQAGYEVELHDYGTGTNVIGRKAGTELPEEIVVLSAHYDTVPDCPGADDNGSGIAGLIASAEALAQADYERTLVVACWDEEELGYLGSTAWVDEAKKEDLDVVASVVFEMIGYKTTEEHSQTLPEGFDLLFSDQAAAIAAGGYRGDFIAVVSDMDAALLAGRIGQASESLGTEAVRLEVADELLGSGMIGDLRRSDHDPFWQAGYPAIMLTDTAEMRNPGYHCLRAEDSLETIDFTFARNVAAAAVVGLATELGIR